ncbi:MAG: class I SAM-dependent methyltransferase [Terriglobales bacterium]
MIQCLNALRNLWTFVRESTPARRRQRYGDMEYDWEHRVNTTSGTVRWRDRLLGLFHSPYQPTDPALFHEMMASLAILSEQFAFNAFTFVDLGSGKGRTLLMASQYPFRRIMGVELLLALHQIAQENLARYKSESQKCFNLEAVRGDATDFSFPSEPLVLYLFNPLPEPGLRRVVTNLDQSLSAYPRDVYVLYHNPLLEEVLGGSTWLTKIGGTQQYSIYGFRRAAS